MILIFQDIFDWAGSPRTTITFCCQFIEAQGIMINRKLFEENAGYVRTVLVAYNAFFSDGSDFSKKEYLYNAQQTQRLYYHHE